MFKQLEQVEERPCAEQDPHEYELALVDNNNIESYEEKRLKALFLALSETVKPVIHVVQTKLTRGRGL